MATRQDPVHQRRRLLPLLRRTGPLYHVTDLLSSIHCVVSGDSMEPNLLDGDRLLASRLEYRLRPPHRGDVVVLRDPSRSGRLWVKRIVGLPGEMVGLQGGRVLVEGQPLEEPYPVRPDPTPGRYDVQWVLEADEYFLLGDNRADSGDSRRFGPVSRRHILGRAWLRYWPRGRWGRLCRGL